jgi:hypothetical protein
MGTNPNRPAPKESTNLNLSNRTSVENVMILGETVVNLKQDESRALAEHSRMSRNNLLSAYF